MSDKDPMQDYISEWIAIWAKVKQQIGASMPDNAAIKITRDIIGPFSPYWLERNMEYYGFKSANEYMKRHMVEAIEKFATPEIPTPGFQTADKMGQTSFTDSSGLTVHVEGGPASSYKIIIGKENTYDHRKSLHDLGLTWNTKDKQWEGELPLDKIQAVRDFCATTGLTFKTG